MSVTKRKVKFRKVKSIDEAKTIQCGCGSFNVAPIYYRAFVSASDVLVGIFTAMHKWFCVDCHHEFDIEPEHQEYWREQFATHGLDNEKS